MLMFCGTDLMLLIVYQHYKSSQAGASSSNAGAGQAAAVSWQDAVGASYAQLAGQEQSDVAALSNRDRSDVSSLQAGINAATTQKQRRRESEAEHCQPEERRARYLRDLSTFEWQTRSTLSSPTQEIAGLGSRQITSQPTGARRRPER
jgi:hypothetical protein